MNNNKDSIKRKDKLEFYILLTFQKIIRKISNNNSNNSKRKRKNMLKIIKMIYMMDCKYQIQTHNLHKYAVQL